MSAKFFDSQQTDVKTPMTATLFKVYCYHNSKDKKDKRIWWEVECMATNQGISWSPSCTIAVSKAEKLGYTVTNKDKPMIRFYRS